MLDPPMQIGRPNGVRSSDWLGEFIMADLFGSCLHLHHVQVGTALLLSDDSREPHKVE